MPRKLFSKDYSDEALYDLEREVSEAVDKDYNEQVKTIPLDRHGFRTGTFHVEITWNPE